MLPQRLPLDQMQVNWAQQLNPIIANPLLQGHLIMNQTLINGTTIVNHGLGRKLIGWFVVGMNAPATIYDNQAGNQMPQLTLSLTSNASIIANLWVF